MPMQSKSQQPQKEAAPCLGQQQGIDRFCASVGNQKDLLSIQNTSRKGFWEIQLLVGFPATLNGRRLKRMRNQSCVFTTAQAFTSKLPGLSPTFQISLSSPPHCTWSLLRCYHLREAFFHSLLERSPHTSILLLSSGYRSPMCKLILINLLSLLHEHKFCCFFCSSCPHCLFLSKELFKMLNKEIGQEKQIGPDDQGLS